jgi:FMN phosphatase YigB (HAD superfamily)
LIKAVYFDLDDTLYDQLQPFQLAVQSTDLVQHINERLSIEDLYRRIRRHSDRLWEKHISGQMTLEELRIERAVAAFLDLSIEITAESACCFNKITSWSKPVFRLEMACLSCSSN